MDKGFVNLPAFRSNGKEQLRELIRQHCNHPSICVWGLFNELTQAGDDPTEYIEELKVARVSSAVFAEVRVSVRV